MITLNFKTLITLIVLIFFTGFAVSFLFKGCSDKATANTVKIIPVKVIKTAEARLEANYKAKFTELENKNVLLQQELETSRQQLAAIRIRTKQKEADIKKLIAPKGMPAKELLNKIDQLPGITENSFSTCDSLKNEVSEYITQNQLKDSLYDSHVVTLDSVIAVKDSLITARNELYYKLKALFNQSLTQQQNLVSDNRFLQKKLKRQKFKSKVVAIGFAIVTGLATDYLIHH